MRDMITIIMWGIHGVEFTKSCFSGDFKKIKGFLLDLKD